VPELRVPVDGTEGPGAGDPLAHAHGHASTQVSEPQAGRQRRELERDANRCTNDVWQSALLALGAYDETQKFGEPKLATKPLEGLWI